MEKYNDNSWNVEDKDSVELFLDAARFGDLSLVVDLYSQYSNKRVLEGRDEFQNTPLHLASGNGHLEVVKFLVSQGANVNALNDAGNTPLHWAALLGELQVVEYLLSQGADPCIHNEFQRTPLDEALGKGHSSVVSVLEKVLESQGKTDTSWLKEDT